MIIQQDTYKPREIGWEELRERIHDLSESNSGMKNGNATFGRSIVFDDKYFCNVSVYDKTQRVATLYIGIDRKKGKELLEAKLGLKLERTDQLERILSPEEIAHLEEADKKRLRVSGPIEI